MAIDVDTLTTITANLVSIVLPLAGFAFAIYRRVDTRLASIDDRFASIDDRFASMDDRFTSIEDRLGALETTVSLLVEAEQERDPGFFARVEQLGPSRPHA